MTKKSGKEQAAGNNPRRLSEYDPKMQKAIERELKAMAVRRRILAAALGLIALVCLGAFFYYQFEAEKNRLDSEQFARLKENAQNSSPSGYTQQIHYSEAQGEASPRPILPEYQELANYYKRLIGWIKIDDTNIDYPVMQTVDNEYYLTHNISQEEDKNGAIFMDKDCDPVNGNTNWIIYGHHMHSGRMFGTLDKYAAEDFYQAHPTFQFDTIYEKGTWQVLYVFRSRVYTQTEITFKYYQFIDAASEEEFDSAMYEMSQMSLYDTGVMAAYGDRLLTLSTCDSYEKYGRFVVVAKKIE